MLNIIGTALIVVGTLLVAANSHGSDMGRSMTELGIFGKLFASVWKYPLALAAIAGSFIGAAIFVAYQKKDRLKQLLINTGFAIVIAPGAFEITGVEPTPARWLALCVLLGLSSGLILRLWVDKHASRMAQDALLHRLARFIGGEGYHPEEKAKNEP